MLFSLPKSLKENLITLLAERPGLSVNELFKAISARRKAYTIQAIYKELRSLQKQGISVKIHNKFYLRTSWLLDIESRVESMVQNSLSSSLVEQLFAEKNEQVIRTTSLLKLNNILANLLLELVNRSKSKQLFGFTSHAWYHLVQEEAENAYLRAVSKAGGKVFYALYGKTKLDKETEQFLHTNKVEFTYTQKSIVGNINLEVDVIDDFIITTKKDPHTVSKIESLYKTTDTKNQFLNSQLFSIFTQPAKIRLTCEKNPTKARLIRRRFARLFGIRLLS